MPYRSACALWVLLISLAAPNPALANKWFGWLEDLSGPGPFRGNTLRFDLVCVGRLHEPAVKDKPELIRALSGDDDAAREAAARKLTQATWCRANRTNVKASIGYEQGWWDAEDSPRYSGTVNLQTYLAIVFVPVRAPFLAPGQPDETALRAFEAGVGVGGYRMSGSAVNDSSYWRLTVPFRTRLFPSELLPPNPKNRFVRIVQYIVRPVSVYGGWDYLPGELPSSQFALTDAIPPRRLSRREWVPVRGFNFDVLAYRRGQSLFR